MILLLLFLLAPRLVIAFDPYGVGLNRSGNGTPTSNPRVAVTLCSGNGDDGGPLGRLYDIYSDGNDKKFERFRDLWFDVGAWSVKTTKENGLQNLPSESWDYFYAPLIKQKTQAFADFIADKNSPGFTAKSTAIRKGPLDGDLGAAVIEGSTLTPEQTEQQTQAFADFINTISPGLITEISKGKYGPPYAPDNGGPLGGDLVAAVVEGSTLTQEQVATLTQEQVAWIVEQMAKTKSTTASPPLVKFIAANAGKYSADPKKRKPVGEDDEYYFIEEALKLINLEKKMKIDPIFSARFRDLVNTLNYSKPQVLHISCHGTEGGTIEFVSLPGMNQKHIVSKDDLIKLFSVKEADRMSASHIPLLVLNVCFSSDIANALTALEHGIIVDCAIGMKGSVPVNDAIHFTTGFYSMLAEGRYSLQGAFDIASAASRGFPHLSVRDGINASEIFLEKMEK